MASDGDSSKRLTITAVVARLARYAQTAARPGGIRYLARRGEEVAAIAVNNIMAPTVEWMEEQRQWASDWLEAGRAWSQRLLQGLTQPQDVMLVAGNELGRLVAEQIRMKKKPIDIAVISTVEDYAVAAGIAALPRPARRIFQVADPTESGSGHDFNVEIPRDHTASEASTLVVYASPGFLSLWERLEEDIDRFLMERVQVILVFVQPRFCPLDFASHSYLLSLLLSCFPTRKFDTSLEVYLAPERRPTREARMTHWTSILRANGWRLLKQSCVAICGHSIGESPQSFSALVISVKRPPERMIAHVDYRSLGSTNAIIPLRIGAARRSDGASVLGPGFWPRVGSRIQVRLQMNGFLTWHNEFVVAVWRSDSPDFPSLVKRFARAGQRVFIDHKFEFIASTMSRIDLEVRIGLSRSGGMVYVNGDPSGQDHSLPVPFLEIRELN
jgi:hypothetical protein